MEDGIQSEPQFHSVLASLRPPSSCRRLTCSGSARLHLGPGHVLFSRLPLAGRPFSSPPQPLSVFPPLMDWCRLRQGCRPQFTPACPQVRQPSGGFSPVIGVRRCSRDPELLGKHRLRFVADSVARRGWTVCFTNCC